MYRVSLKSSPIILKPYIFAFTSRNVNVKTVNLKPLMRSFKDLKTVKLDN